MVELSWQAVRYRDGHELADGEVPPDDLGPASAYTCTLAGAPPGEPSATVTSAPSPGLGWHVYVRKPDGLTYLAAVDLPLGLAVLRAEAVLRGWPRRVGGEHTHAAAVVDAIGEASEGIAGLSREIAELRELYGGPAAQPAQGRRRPTRIVRDERGRRRRE